ncbi:MAG: hypothetical protein QM731_21885 [Chitinophagaceae bacterium]
MSRRILMAGIFMLCLLNTSCRKDHDKTTSGPEETVTPVGTPTGDAIHKTIDANGGEIASADGTIRVSIPAGALSTATDISVQPVSNELPGGIGNAWRLMPHGLQFQKPVTISFQYKAADTVGSRADFLDIAFQDASGTWQMLTNTTVNRAQKKIIATTTHFSDWNYLKSINLTPSETTVEQEESLDLKITTRFPRLDPDDAPPGTYTVKVLKEPRELRPDEIKGWHYSGEGILISRATEGYYTAPDHLPAANPEAVTVEINIHRKGLFMLVSNITVTGDEGVDYLQVDEDNTNPLNGGMCALYMYGKFGNDPGAGKRSVKINSTTVQVDLWSPTVIRCKIDETISGAIEIANGNKIVARSVLRKFAGDFVYERFHGGLINSNSPNPLKETTTFTFVYRGFAQPCPASVKPLFQIDMGLAMGTIAHYALSGQASVTTPVIQGCRSTTSVSLPMTRGQYFLEPNSAGGSTIFISHVKDIVGGIEIKLDYAMENVLKNVIVERTSSCGPGSFDPPRTLGVGLEGFNNKAINFEFLGRDGLILKGTNQLRSNRMSTGILIEAWDGTGNPSHYETDGLMPATFSNAN